MLKTSLALILIALQGLCALPGRLHLCFEADGSICCVEGGEHLCDCDHACGHAEEARHDCEHAASNESLPCSDDAATSTDCGEERSHQHLVIAVADHQSVITRAVTVDVDEFSNSFALAALVSSSELLLSALPVFTPIRFETPAASFSLFARASTVLRC